MNKTIKLILRFLAIIPILALFSFYGCPGTTTETDNNGTITTPTTDDENGDTLSQEQLQRILSNAVNKHQSLNTYKYNMSSLIFTEITGGSQPGTITVDSAITGASNAAAEELEMRMETTVTTTGNIGQSPPEFQNLLQEFYQVPGMLYIYAEMQTEGSLWAKIPLEAGVVEKYQLDSVDKQIAALEAPEKIEYLRSEKVDNVDCFVLSVTPDNDKLIDWISQQNTGSMEPDWEEVGRVAEGIKEVSYTCYVTKDSHLLVRLVAEIQMEFEPEMIGAADIDFSLMMSDMKVDLKIYDLDKPWNVTLPYDPDTAIVIE